MKGKQKSVHFVAIGGIGMSALALILLKEGYKVSGSDVRNTDIVKKLTALGADIHIGHDGSNVPADCDEVIYSTVIHEDNPEIVEAKKRNLPITHRGTLLARLVNEGYVVAVAGAHGKTTTSAMAAQIFRMAGKSPNIILGGVLPLIDGNAEKGNSDIWVVEADESDGSFLKIVPGTTIITNIEPEHMEHYGTLSNLKKAFTNFSEQSREVIVCADDTIASEVAQTLSKKCHTYGIYAKDADLTAKNIQFDKLGSKAEIYFKGEKAADLALAVPGEHNILNAMAAMYSAYTKGIPFKESAGYLGSFNGTGRRFEIIYRDEEKTLVDDYAHHPSEVRATIAAAKNGGFKRVIAVFQPHRYSRVKDLYVEFGKAFDEADVVIIDEIYSAWEPQCENISSALIVDEIKKRNIEAIRPGSAEALFKTVTEITEPGDLILMMGAGDIMATARKIRDYFTTAAKHR